MKPTTETIIAAMRAGLATRAEFLEHIGCDSRDLDKPLSNMVQRDLAERYIEDGTVGYRLTKAGKAWKPTRPAKAVQAAAPADKIDAIFATAPELQYLAPEDYALPEPEAERKAINEQQAAEAVMASLRAELANAKALNDKLQTLLDSARHEADVLRQNVTIVAPGLETVPLATLLGEIGSHLDDHQAITVHPQDVVTVKAFGREFVGTYREANPLLDAAATLMRAELPA